MGLEIVMSALGGIAAALITGWLSFLRSVKELAARQAEAEAELEARRLEAVAALEAAREAARGPEWSAMFEQVKDWAGDQLRARDVIIERLDRQVSQMQTQLDKVNMRYYAAIHHIRDYRRKHPDKDLVPPEEILADLYDI